MESRITVVQALDERDLLIKKIKGKVEKAQFVDLMKPKASVTLEKHMTKSAFASQAQSALQQIQDLITRYDALNEAITMSNAETFLDTSRGRMSVSCAISLRNRLRGSGPFGELTDFEGKLVHQMEENFRTMQETQRRKNDIIRRESASRQKKGKIFILRNADEGARSQESAGEAAEAEGKEQKVVPLSENMDQDNGRRSGISAKDKSQKNPDLLRVVDPLNVRRKAESILESREALLMELDTRIKISNATTYIEV
ncbi:MAG: hypothetical protein IJ390_09310 [Lachnospiraceae bacterium]|nr:hypothetical protein [Lachnospiraceae bacterium]